MSQYLTNIGKVETAGAASIGAVSIINSAGWIVGLMNGTGLVGTMNTVAIGGGSTVSVVNSAGWIMNIANTGGQIGLYAGTGLVGTMNTVAIGGNVSINNTAGLVVSVANTGGVYSLANTAGWVVSVANTGGAYTLASGTALVGTMNTVNAGGYISLVNTAGWAVNVINTAGLILAANQSGVWSVNIINSAGWIVNTANVFVQVIAGSAMMGTAYVQLLGANSVNLTAGVASIGTASVILMNTANWYVNVVNTAGLAVNVINTAGIAVNVINTAGLIVALSSHRVDTTIETMTMTSSGIDLTPNYSFIEVSATNNLLVAASAGKVLRVLSYQLMAGVANNSRFQSGSNSTTFLTGTMFLGASGGMVTPFNPVGQFQTTAGSPLYLLCAGANSVGGCLTYLVI